ncbi:MAG: MFS transporter [Actinomyces sp.]|nr:MFS transporter [Actinomyces sp.]MCI1641685.1 MFS transporter [Actinomyces sp.]MCI1661842.1 MFS transporter [Actinomyces sp.]MCI1690684.1 MFS transporter [Actinomyces sp.]MCI1786716.1 MFS transporter [Actinomyces sp.]MCI1829142.1 MFS transporter [Actinomyces sp.]
MLAPYAFIAGFGLVSLLMDTVYEAALAVQGPLLARLGASAALIGLVSGLGEATALIGRLFSGPAADRSGRYWAFALVGYAMTAVAVPAMGFVGSVAGVSTLIVAERLGKSVRTPSRDAMLANAASVVGRGRGFALHELLDQVGAVAGPLIVAGVLQASGNDYRVALGVLAAPGVAAVVVLLFLRRRVPVPRFYEDENREPRDGAFASQAPVGEPPGGESLGLPARFWMYMLFAGVLGAGISTFGVLSYHMVRTGIVADSGVPLVYALAMGVDAVVALVTGMLYDRIGMRTLVALPLVAAVIPWFAYGSTLAGVLVGAVLWGVVTGVQESTMRAAVAGLVPGRSRATAYGVFSVALGCGALVGGWAAGWLYGAGPNAIAWWSGAVESCALVLVVILLQRSPEA